MTTEPTDAELAVELCEGADNIARKYPYSADMMRLAAASLSRRPADGGAEGAREKVAKTMQQAIIDANQRWNLTDAMALTVADAILALVSPAAVRRTALIEIAEFAERLRGQSIGSAEKATEARHAYMAVAAHCRRLAQQGGE